jgi:toxin LF subunit
MSVDERRSGITAEHIAAIEDLMASENSFMFVRPTEFDSTILIKAGYATKSMDVHHKSSNWGPMAGFVPCDPAFNKKCDGKPNPQEHEHKHGAANPVQLALTQKLLSSHEKIEAVDGFVLAKSATAGKLDIPWVVQRVAKGHVGGLTSKFEASASGGGGLPTHRFYNAKPTELGNKSTLFCLIEKAGEWLVYWVSWNGDTGNLNPLRVFAYVQNGRLNPVTGDYDLWMVAPHMKHMAAHLLVKAQVDKHGSSAASPYTLRLIGALNLACKRANNPVFNHGAEAQNYGFTQNLDWDLAMFTPAGTSRMVRMGEMPKILADLQRAGYLVVWNKRYGETDPRFMGAPDRRGNLAEIRETLVGLFRELDQFRSTVTPTVQKTIASQASNSKQMPKLLQDEIKLAAQKSAASRNLGIEQGRVFRFNRALQELLQVQTGPFLSLKSADYPAGYRGYQQEMLTLHTSLQKAIVDASTGGGESDETKLKAWMSAHQKQLETLKTYWA